MALMAAPAWLRPEGSGGDPRLVSIGTSHTRLGIREELQGVEGDESSIQSAGISGGACSNREMEERLRAIYLRRAKIEESPSAEPLYIRACRLEDWHLRLWRRDGTGEEVNAKFKCGSWRHEGECARRRAAQDFARISKALEDYKIQELSFFVLTFDRMKFRNQWDAYKGLVRCWQTFSQALRREFGELAYVSVAEQHRNGWPHLNVVVACKNLGARLRDNKQEANAGDGHPLAIYKRGLRDWLITRAKRAGFGAMVSVELVRNKKKMADYVVKLASVENVVGEVSKLSQTPVQAPKGFRRLRSSRGFLPPIEKDEEWTGELVLDPMPGTDDPKKYFPEPGPGVPAGWTRPQDTVVVYLENEWRWLTPRQADERGLLFDDEYDW